MLIWFWWAIGLTITTLVSAWMVKKHRDLGFPVLMSFFALYVISANILVPRLVNLNLGITMAVLTTGSIIWPFTAQLSDMINEVYGRKRAYLTAGITYLMNLIFVTFVFMGASVTPLWGIENESFWLAYFKPGLRILIASSASFLICQGIDVFIFSKLKQYVYKAEQSASIKKIVYLCTLRSATSDLLNMILDGVLFAVFAFLFVLPTDALIQLIIGSVTAKGILAIVDTPWFIAFRVLIRDVKRDM